MSDQTIEETAFLEALNGDKALSLAELTKELDADKDDVEALLSRHQAREVVERDDEASTKTTDRFRLSSVGQNRLKMRTLGD